MTRDKPQKLMRDKDRERASHSWSKFCEYENEENEERLLILKILQQSQYKANSKYYNNPNIGTKPKHDLG